MKQWIALLRGVNVGGRNKLPMESLSSIFAKAGCENATTYIQSGNVVFEADFDPGDEFAEAICEAIESKHGFRPAVSLVSGDSLQHAVASNPYPGAVSDHRSLHVFFLERSPGAEQMDAARKLLSESESMQIIGTLLYLHAPNGIGRSKFVSGVERALRMRATARNWRTVTKLAELAAEHA